MFGSILRTTPSFWRVFPLAPNLKDAWRNLDRFVRIPGTHVFKQAFGGVGRLDDFKIGNERIFRVI
jgi:hypothetical protein